MKWLASLTSLFLLCSCALDIDYHMPSNRFDTPEVSGVFLGGDVSVSHAAGHKVTLGEVYEDIIFHSGIHALPDSILKKPIRSILKQIWDFFRASISFIALTMIRRILLGQKFSFLAAEEPRSKMVLSWQRLLV